jgi:bifunctional UDP-N-acetylglucosamine pyrophosphorylase / glucosamine-1-phosphate N-acetyltransferase
MIVLNILVNYFVKCSKIIYLLGMGVKFSRPFTTEIVGSLLVGKNVSIGSNVTFRGKVELGNNVLIEDNCSISDSSLSDDSHVKINTSIQGTKVGKKTFLGPFARVRGFSEIGGNCQIGNFVEIKNSIIGNYARINHMAFIGDSFLQDNVTIGAGVITCNHDGESINETIIEEGAYVGSNSNLIAPLTIGRESTIGSGSTISLDVLEKTLVLARPRQQTIESWQGSRKKRKRK